MVCKVLKWDFMNIKSAKQQRLSTKTKMKEVLKYPTYDRLNFIKIHMMTSTSYNLNGATYSCFRLNPLCKYKRHICQHK